MNWNSKTKTFSEVKSDRVKGLVYTATCMKGVGASIAEIADTLELSKGRVYELLKSSK